MWAGVIPLKDPKESIYPAPIPAHGDLWRDTVALPTPVDGLAPEDERSPIRSVNSLKYFQLKRNGALTRTVE
jgi:hypothetical protein